MNIKKIIVSNYGSFKDERFNLCMLDDFESYINNESGKIHFIKLLKSLLEKGHILVTSNICFDKKMNPIDCVVSQKKIEIVSKIIKPIKEKIISVTDLLIIGNSRVLRI